MQLGFTRPSTMLMPRCTSQLAQSDAEPACSAATHCQPPVATAPLPPGRLRSARARLDYRAYAGQGNQCHSAYGPGRRAATASPVFSPAIPPAPSCAAISGELRNPVSATGTVSKGSGTTDTDTHTTNCNTNATVCNPPGRAVNSLKPPTRQITASTDPRQCTASTASLPGDSLPAASQAMHCQHGSQAPRQNHCQPGVVLTRQITAD